MVENEQTTIEQQVAEAEAEFLHAQGEGTTEPPDSGPYGPSPADSGQDEEPVQIDFSELSEADARSVLFNGLIELGNMVEVLNQRQMALAQSFVRILEAAGVAEEGTQPKVEVARTMPKMAVPGPHATHKTRNSQ